MLILKIAWRSLLRHKAKSIIIGAILFLGAFIMTLGDATTIGMRRGRGREHREELHGQHHPRLQRGDEGQRAVHARWQSR